MATTLLNKEKLTATRFWGGDARGVMLDLQAQHALNIEGAEELIQVLQDYIDYAKAAELRRKEISNAV